MVDIPSKSFEEISKLFHGLSTSAKISAADIYALTGNLSELQKILKATGQDIRLITESFDRSTIELNKMLALFGNFSQIPDNVKKSWNSLVSSLKKVKFDEINDTLYELSKTLDSLQDNILDNSDAIVQAFKVHSQSLNDTVTSLEAHAHALKQVYGDTAVTNYIQALKDLQNLLNKGAQIDVHSLIAFSNSADSLQSQLINIQKSVRNLQLSFSNFNDASLKSIIKMIKNIDLSLIGMTRQNIEFQVASQNFIQKSKDLPAILGNIGGKLSTATVNMFKLGTELSQFGPRWSAMINSLFLFFKAIPAQTLIGPGALVILGEVLKLFRRGITMTSDLTRALGPSVFTLNNLSETLRNITATGFSGALMLKNTDEIMKLIGTTLKHELYPAWLFVDNKLAENASNIAVFAEHIDTFAKGIGQTGDDLMKKLLYTSSLLNTKLTDIGSDLARQLTNQWARLNRMALSGLGLNFEAISDMGKHAFDEISFMGARASKTVTDGTLMFLSTVKDALMKTTDDISWNMRQLRTAYQSIMTGIEQASWETYYGVLAMGGKLSNNLEADLERVFSTSPLERFIETYKTMQKIGEGAGVGKVWTALTNTIGKIPNTLVVPITKALKSIDMTQLENLTKNPEEFWNQLLRGQNVSPDEIAKLQRATSALEDPLQTISTFVKKIYDFLASWTTPLSSWIFKK